MTTSEPSPTEDHIGRRRFLLLGAAATVTACTTVNTAGPGDPGGTTTTAPPVPSTGSADEAGSEPGADAAGSTVSGSETADDLSPAALALAGAPALTPDDFEFLADCPTAAEASAGPFGLDEQFRRADITEGLAGLPLRLGIRVVDGDCSPVPGAEVEVWHTDATGDYSAFVDDGGGKDDGPGSTFLRGNQPVDTDGIATFVTVYPGWYPGRTPHVHLRVRRNNQAVFTTQLYFPDDVSAEVYGRAPYAEFGPADTTNATDGIAEPDAPGALLAIRADVGDRARALTALGSLAIDTA